jgi:hypothetical protein
MMQFALHGRPRSRLRLGRIAVAVLLALLTAAGLAASAQAATYTVGTNNDVAGACAPSSQTCSLRQLIEYENQLPATPSPPDAILVPANSYSLSNGALLITQTLAIIGAGARTTSVGVPAGIPAQRVFEVKPPANGGESPSVVIAGFEISGGTANESNGSFGGDVYNSASLVLNEDWITQGSASSGGGISNDTGVMAVQHSLVSRNHATSGGADSGGIQNHGSAGAPGKKAVLLVENSTIAENDARLGAGIFSWSDEPDGNEISVVNSTIAHNSTKEETGGPARGPGAGILVTDGTSFVVNSIVAFNSESTAEEPLTYTNCSTTVPGGTTGAITSLGYNLESGTDCGFQMTGDKQNGEPQFGSETPQNNGGNTDTLAPKPTSPAIDAIPTSSLFCANTDQRGVTRPQGAGCDIGAVESGNAVVIQTPPPPPAAPPTLVTTAPPSVVSTTSATFTATVNPHGLATTVHFEYGGTFGGATVAAITYGSSTPNQSVPADFANHTVTATVTSLLPNVVYHVRAVASNSAGSALGPDQILTTPADPPPPPPVLGKTANVAPVSGIVYVELPVGATLASFSPSALPLQAFAALTKGRAFIPLTEARQIPFGSILDTSAGVAHITTASVASARGKLQFGDFGAGIFKLLQRRRQRGLTELDIIDNHSARQVCASKGKRARAASGHPSSKVLGHLRANSHGHFTARGQFSAATVRGTVWGVLNRCDGTLTRVTRGVLSVRDFRLRKTITLFTGQSYLARAPGKHG